MNYKNQFIDRCRKDKILSENTISAYEHDIDLFEKFISEKDIKIDNVKKRHIKEYVQSMAQDCKSSATIRRCLVSIKKYFEYLINRKIIRKNPVIGIAIPKIERQKADVLSLEEIDRLLNFNPDSSEKSLRDKAMFEVIYATGMHVSELLDIKVCDIDLNSGMILCKGSGSRVVPIGTKAVMAINEYLKLRKCESEYLFVNVYGEKMSRQGFWKIIKSYKENSGITKEVTPRILRRSLAVHLASNGMDAEILKKILGLKSDASVKIYIDTANEELRNEYFKLHPRV